MKKLFYQVLNYALVVLVASCNTTNPPSQDDPMLESQLAIIKLTPEMEKNIFVAPVVDSVVIDYQSNQTVLYYEDELVLCSPTTTDSILSEFAQTEFNIVGSNPYIMLDNGYAIIDWKWSHFQPLSGAYRNAKFFNAKQQLPSYSSNPYRFHILENEEYYLLPLTWQELNSLTSKWEMKEGTRIEKLEIRYINLLDIEKYGNYQKGYKDLKNRFNVLPNDLQTTYNLYVRDKAMCGSYIEEYDKLQSSYVETLNQIINNNDLEKWTQYIK